MFLLLWTTVLLCEISADTGASVWGKQHCPQGYCVTLSEGELTAEAGLCVVIPCSFTTIFTPRHVIWSKRIKAGQTWYYNRIFHTDKSQSVQSEFRGRVSLLEPDVSQRNCSIMINDLRESDSGFYQLRVEGFKQSDAFTFTSKAAVTVKGLSQKPTVVIPPLTAGQQTTLTCTAPGLCSGSAPKFTWSWRGKTTAYKSEETQRHTSTLTFNPLPKHHSTSVTCTVSFRGDITTEETQTVNVSYVKEVKITGRRKVTEGETLSLNCSVESFPPSLITWAKMSESDLQEDTDTFTQDQRTGALSIYNVTAEDSGQYVCTATHLNKTHKMRNVTVTVIYIRKPQISGSTAVNEGDVLSLTCSAESFPPSVIMWTKLSSNTTLHNGIGSASLVIPNVTAEHSGQYICTANHLNTTLTERVTVTVTWITEIQTGSVCELQSDVLTCWCVSEGFPLPTFKWPLLEDHTQYSVVTSVSKQTVNSTVTVRNHGNTAVECVASNENREVKANLTIQKKLPEAGKSEEIFQTASRLEVIIAFLIGVVLSAVVCCLAIKCHRNKQKKSENVDETMEMIIPQGNMLVHENGAVDRGTTDTELNSGPKDVEYASIDFSLLKRMRPSEVARRKQESTETEYSEVKRQVREEKKEDAGEEGETLERKEEEVMVEEDEETRHYVSEEENRGDEAVYSNVKEIMYNKDCVDRCDGLMMEPHCD
ncbi:sialic acid-binding Ig-like lectin 10 isoform X2 [Parambassis ranga]|uniref:Sialic acid-binding Ig-like lectin 10 isoform X2 n=1 Tax=Parambassis ranga TaxID=210632 RepID=A0A6P7JUI7_9TELE|nr:sialic acid-binding Ig-like lectin 10 isoform X2 [Parambassis ranga]XP_028280625.1 sialic acid-binding Ig-like lectin 10 isoform X2 [Parambassis ranga]